MFSAPVAIEDIDWYLGTMPRYYHEKSGVSFLYPAGYAPNIQEDGEIIFLELGTPAHEGLGISVRYRNTGLSTAEELASHLRVVDEEIIEKEGFNPDEVSYSVWQEEINGFQLVFHRRDFAGWTGNLYEVYVVFGGGNVLFITTEESNLSLGAMYHSFERL